MLLVDILERCYSSADLSSGLVVSNIHDTIILTPYIVIKYLLVVLCVLNRFWLDDVLNISCVVSHALFTKPRFKTFITILLIMYHIFSCLRMPARKDLHYQYVMVAGRVVNSSLCHREQAVLRWPRLTRCISTSTNL